MRNHIVVLILLLFILHASNLFAQDDSQSKFETIRALTVFEKKLEEEKKIYLTFGSIVEYLHESISVNGKTIHRFQVISVGKELPADYFRKLKIAKAGYVGYIGDDYAKFYMKPIGKYEFIPDGIYMYINSVIRTKKEMTIYKVDQNSGKGEKAETIAPGTLITYRDTIEVADGIFRRFLLFSKKESSSKLVRGDSFYLKDTDLRDGNYDIVYPGINKHFSDLKPEDELLVVVDDFSNYGRMYIDTSNVDPEEARDLRTDFYQDYFNYETGSTTKDIPMSISDVFVIVGMRANGDYLLRPKESNKKNYKSKYAKNIYHDYYDMPDNTIVIFIIDRKYFMYLCNRVSY